MPDQIKGILYASFTALLWGFLAIALKVALYDLEPVTVVWFRFFIAFLSLLILLSFTDRSYINTLKKPPKRLFIAAFFLGMNYLGFISGIHETSPSNAQVFIQIGPVSLAVAGIVIFKEKLTLRQTIGFLILLNGFGLFYSEQLTGFSGGAGHYSKGVVFVIFGGLSWAVFSVNQKIMVRNRDPNHLNLFIYGFCSLMFLPFVEFSKLHSLTTADWFLLIFLGLNTFFAYGSLALAFKYTEAKKVSVIITLNPVITFIVMAFLGAWAVSWIEPEFFTALSIAGAVLVFTGALTVALSRKKRG